MSGINCPVCGKRNPAGSEICQFCEARLEPRMAYPSPQNSSSSDSTQDQTSDIPNWLATFRQSVVDRSEPEDRSDSALERLNDLKDDTQDVGISPQRNQETDDMEGKKVPDERNLPDWLKDIILVEKPIFDPTDRAGEKGEVEQEEPEWLKSSGAGRSVTPKDETDLADWFEAPEESTSEKNIPAGAAAKAEFDNQQLAGNYEPLPPSIEWPPRKDEQEVLDWLDRPGRAVESSHMEGETVSEDFPQELPSWLSELNEPELDRSEGFVAANSTSIPVDLDDDLRGALTEDSFVEQETESLEEARFLEILSPGGETEIVSGDETGAAGEMRADQTGDLSWLDDLGASVPDLDIGSEWTENPEELPGAVKESAAGLETAGDLRNWVQYAETGKVPGVDEGNQLPEEEQAPLTPADLPSWLKAMRPVVAYETIEGSSKAGESDLVSAVGPLAGLRGVLPAEPDVAQVTKPPIYSTKIHYSDIQQAHAELLAGLIQSEGEASPLPPAPLLISQTFLRLLIAVILFGVILFSVLTGVPVPNRPNFTPEVFTVSQLIAGLPAAQPVLVAIDYSPGFAGEVGAAVEAIISHLVTKDVFIAFVSTKPEGPLQAELVAGKFNQQNQMTDYANLGFVPGGSTGLLAFTLDPQNTAPKDIHAESAWELPALQPVETLDDFAAIIVATENADTARSWIEQARLYLNTTPMILVVSAQNEPLIRPYYDSYPRQIQGLLIGYPAAVIYETILGRSTQTTARWTPFAVGLSVGVLLIFIGAIVNLLVGFIIRSKENKRTREQP